MSSDNKNMGNNAAEALEDPDTVMDDAMDSTSGDPDGIKGITLSSFEIAVPVKRASPSGDSSTSSGTRSRSGVETPATSVTVTPADSDTKNTRPRRVNASARALELRQSAFSLNRTTRGKKRTIGEVVKDNSPSESSDARLARALQAEEYQKGGSAKLAKLPNTRNAFFVPNSTDDEGEDLRAQSKMFTSGSTQKSLAYYHKRNSTVAKDEGIFRFIDDSEASDLSDIDMDKAGLNEVAAEMEEEDDEYEEPGADDKGEVSSMDTDPDEEEKPVVSTAPHRGWGRRRRRRGSPTPPLSPGMARLGPRVRAHFHLIACGADEITGTKRA